MKEIGKSPYIYNRVLHFSGSALLLEPGVYQSCYSLPNLRQMAPFSSVFVAWLIRSGFEQLRPRATGKLESIMQSQFISIQSIERPVL